MILQLLIGHVLLICRSFLVGSSADNGVSAELEVVARHLSSQNALDLAVHYSANGFVLWDVTYNPKTLPTTLGSSVQAPNGDLLADWRLRWYSDLNRTLVARTNDILCGKVDKGFNPDTDIAIVIQEINPDPNGPLLQVVCRQHGSRIVFLVDSLTKENVRILTPEASEPRDRIEVLIKPTRRAWKPFETITGKVVMTNTGLRRFALHPGLDYLALANARTNEVVTNTNQTTGVCGMSAESGQAVALWPGETIELPFQIHTDPLRPDCDINIPHPGIYDITVHDLAHYHNIAYSVDVGVIEIMGHSTLPRRIVSMFSGTKDLLVRWDDETVEAIEPTSGKRMQIAVLKNIAPGRDKIIAINDHRMLAWIKSTIAGFVLHIEGPDDARDILLSDVAKPQANQYHIDAYDGERHQLFVRAPGQLLIIDYLDGTVSERLETSSHVALEPSGQYMVVMDDPAARHVLMVHDLRNESLPYLVNPPGNEASRYTMVHLGMHGIYFMRESEEIIVLDYSGEERARLQTKMTSVASECGADSLAVFTSSSKDAYEVWNIFTGEYVAGDQVNDRIAPILLQDGTLVIGYWADGEQAGGRWLKDEVTVWRAVGGSWSLDLRTSRSSR